MSTPQVRTGPQVTAADPKVSVWVSANAGTGKTQVLTDRITRLLLEGVRPERILCLTFTKAAAAEMATRLSERLGAWAVAGENDLKAEISALLGKPPEDDLLAPARRLFAETLDVPGGLKIRTIHAFCESLLGRFPVEAGIAPHFSVIDERTAAELMAEARNHLLGQAVQENSGDVTRALRLMATLLNEEDFSYMIHINMATELGDSNLDWNVDAQDLAKVRGNFGATAGWASGNSNLDNTVDAADLAMVRENFGFDNPLVSGAPLAVPTPEPAGVLLIALGTVAFRRRRT